MQSHGSTLSANYTKIANELLERTDVDLAAKSLLGFLLIRKGWIQADIKTLSAKFGESQAKISKWMRQLAEVGYLIRRKVRDAKGRWKTMIHAFATPQTFPGADMSSTTMEELAAQSSTHFPSLGQPSLAEPSSYPSGIKTGEKTPPTPSAPVERAKTVPGEESAMSESQAACAAVLTDVGRREPRLRLNALQMAPLLPLVADWRARGAADSWTAERLSYRVPEGMTSPVKLLEWRLRHWTPERVPERGDGRTVAQVLVQPEPKKGECPRCGHLMINRCANCENIRPGQPAYLIDASVKGAGLARELLTKTRAAARVA